MPEASFFRHQSRQYCLGRPEAALSMDLGETRIFGREFSRLAESQYMGLVRLIRVKGFYARSYYNQSFQSRAASYTLNITRFLQHLTTTTIHQAPFCRKDGRR